ncbi:hypothetical protein THTE_1586 [Thermogutta terrifontis]|uniref:Uncharacterized protein n=1 Tax=Thermogutta terrifontis TaxID=1331910 RepID=A0A286RE03_9BACT|nr:hypothetical protein THTE_1586 [Thermogutta terrifontis]
MEPRTPPGFLLRRYVLPKRRPGKESGFQKRLDISSWPDIFKRITPVSKIVMKKENTADYRRVLPCG